MQTLTHNELSSSPSQQTKGPNNECSASEKKSLSACNYFPHCVSIHECHERWAFLFLSIQQCQNNGMHGIPCQTEPDGASLYLTNETSECGLCQKFEADVVLLCNSKFNMVTQTYSEMYV